MPEIGEERGECRHVDHSSLAQRDFSRASPLANAEVGPLEAFTEPQWFPTAGWWNSRMPDHLAPLTFRDEGEEWPARTLLVEERVMNTACAHSSNEPERPRYNLCPACMELWVAAWMARVGVDYCPLCEAPVYPSPGRSGHAAQRTRIQPPGLPADI